MSDGDDEDGNGIGRGRGRGGGGKENEGMQPPKSKKGTYVHVFTCCLVSGPSIMLYSSKQVLSQL